jgi:hypothetical protein
VQDNNLRDVMEASRLTALPNLNRIWLKHNPLTKTYPAYRVKVFNLFRSTAGYVEDIIIDDSPPGYAEKQQLVERVPEKEPRVIRPIVQIVETPLVTHNEARQQVFETTEPSQGSARRRKPNRRRIVDLAHDDAPWRPNGNVTVVSRPSMDGRRSTDSAAPTRLHADVDSFADAASQDHHSAVDMALHSTRTVATTDGDIAATPDDAYRGQAEALRRELGSNWLNALESQDWHSSHRIDLHRAEGMSHGPSLHRAHTMVATSATRTLG